jgi:hypothetical protein
MINGNTINPKNVYKLCGSMTLKAQENTMCTLSDTMMLALFVYSMIKFFVLDVLPRGVVAVSSDPAPDSAFAPSFFGRASGQLP